MSETCIGEKNNLKVNSLVDLFICDLLFFSFLCVYVCVCVRVIRLLSRMWDFNRYYNSGV